MTSYSYDILFIYKNVSDGLCNIEYSFRDKKHSRPRSFGSARAPVMVGWVGVKFYSTNQRNTVGTQAPRISIKNPRQCYSD
jgi:hypothetical protein